MARKLRLESEGGIYHVISRGNYRAPVFRADKTKAAFLNCLDEACAKTGWRVHAWCLMSNHYHLAVETPRANLVEGMRWLQGTFSVRFNRLRQESGHLFQGRYKSLLVDPVGGLGPLCHYIAPESCPGQPASGRTIAGLAVVELALADDPEGKASLV